MSSLSVTDNPLLCISLFNRGVGEVAVKDRFSLTGLPSALNASSPSPGTARRSYLPMDADPHQNLHSIVFLIWLVFWKHSSLPMPMGRDDDAPAGHAALLPSPPRVKARPTDPNKTTARVFSSGNERIL